MKTLVISAAFPPMRAGEADHAFQLCQHLAKRGVDVHVLTTRTWGTPGQPSLHVHPLMRSWSWPDLPRLVSFVKRCAPDVVLLVYIGWIYHDHPMITFAATFSRSLWPGVPFVTQFENAIGAKNAEMPLATRAVRRGVERWVRPAGANYYFGTLLRDSTRIIVLSEHHRRLLAEHWSAVDNTAVLIPPPPLIRIVPAMEGACRQRGRDLLRVAADEFVIIYFGYIYPRKGLETLLEAFQIVCARRANVRLVLVGGTIALEFPDRPSYAEEMRELPKRLGIEDRVTWTGEYDWDSELPSVYLQAGDLCVMPIDIGVQLNNSSFAAVAAHGLPTVATEGDALESPFLHGRNVFLCPPKNARAMAAAIETVVDSPALRESLREGVLQLAREWFSWERATDRTLAALQSSVS
jgi:glycosyltransferase involved in cell wall biosynthesis